MLGTGEQLNRQPRLARAVGQSHLIQLRPILIQRAPLFPAPSLIWMRRLLTVVARVVV
jgi:hypothetical protein